MASKPRAWPSRRIDSASSPPSSTSASAAARMRSRLSGTRGSGCAAAIDKAYGVRLAYAVSLHRKKEGAMVATTTAPATMKAVLRSKFGSTDVLEVGEAERPALTADGVLVRVRAASINRADWYELTGTPLLARPMMGGLRRPKSRLVGTDFAGVAEAVGSEVDDIQPGDEVFGGKSGAFAEYVCARVLVRKPANLSFE